MGKCKPLVVGTLVDGRPRLPTEWLAYCLDSLNAGGLRGTP